MQSPLYHLLVRKWLSWSVEAATPCSCTSAEQQAFNVLVVIPSSLALEANQVAHVNCGNCRMLLMYQYGARSVKCAVCNFVTSVGGSNKHY
ncbi:protein LSD1-like [Actinidia eriantha]|uniref:protein LSD1-like n=1 Tax=Actinidia eriantha TaxID=165200 RepID=UPI00258D611D|nr:protein LSD1-like [Actinidia eriantha]